MKILIITLHADPTINPGAEEGGGTHMYINEIINLLIYKEIEALVITRKASSGENSFEYGSVKVRRIQLGPEQQWSKNNLDQAEDVIQALINEQLTNLNFVPDLIHSIYWHSGRAALYFSSQFKVPFIHTVISVGWRKKMSGYDVSSYRIKTEQGVYANASQIISVSEQEKNDLVKYYEIEPSKIKVIGRGVDNLFLRNLYDERGTLLAKNSPDIYKITDNEF